jgi:uncharacterized protein (TIGR00156 family)
MKFLINIAVAALVGAAIVPAQAQFSGPSVQGRTSTVADIADARLGSYVVLTGNVVSHLRGNYFTFRDSSGEIRVEIEGNVWQGRPVAPETNVRIMGELDSGPAGRYIWVKSLETVQ